jgi:hypothetical protein
MIVLSIKVLGNKLLNMKRLAIMTVLSTKILNIRTLNIMILLSFVTFLIMNSA